MTNPQLHRALEHLSANCFGVTVCTLRFWFTLISIIFRPSMQLFSERKNFPTVHYLPSTQVIDLLVNIAEHLAVEERVCLFSDRNIAASYCSE